MQRVLSAVLNGSGHLASDRQSPATASGRRDAALQVKRGFDVAAVLVFLLLFLPLIATIVAVLLVAQGRPILIRHKRVGKGGTLFPCLKFRTMVVDSETRLREHLASDPAAAAEWAASRKLKNDPRVTPLGRVMRKASLDELPQLVNVLRGEMSLVGPRPIVEAETHHYGAHLQHYHTMRPGLTGSWQVGGRSDVSYGRRVQMDTDYVTGWSLGRDVVILARTLPAVLGSKGSY